MSSQAKTQEYFIGDLDLRISTDLTKAGELGPANGVGLMTDCTVSQASNEVTLKGGFPQKTYATAVTSRDLTISGTLSEYTILNMALLYGDTATYERVKAGVTAAQSTVTTEAAASDVALIVADETNFAVGDKVMVENAADTNDIFVGEITAIDAPTHTLTLSFGVPRVVPVDSRVIKSETIELGAEQKIPTVTVQVFGIMPLDGEPFVYDCWKATVSGTTDVSTSTDNFNGLSYTITPLQPGSEEINCDKFGSDAGKKAMLREFAQGRLTKGVKANSC